MVVCISVSRILNGILRMSGICLYIYRTHRTIVGNRYYLRIRVQNFVANIIRNIIIKNKDFLFTTCTFVDSERPKFSNIGII